MTVECVTARLPGSAGGPSGAQSRAQTLSVAVVVPAHNEAAHVGDVVRSIPAFVDRVIVIDDASTDETAATVRALDDARVHLISHEQNAGVGGAMRTGYKFAMAEGYDLVAKIDADGQMCAEELRRLVDPICLGLADYTKGNRFYFRGATRGMPAERSFGNTLLSFLTKVASGYWHVFDPQCGFTVVRTSFLRMLDVDAIASDYFFENDMLVQLNALGAYVVDVPTSTFYGAEVSGVSVARVALTFPPRLIAAGSRRFWRKHLVTDFGAVAVLVLGGALLSLFGAAFGAYRWWLSSTSGHVATTGTVMIAVLPLVVGIQAILQAFAMSVAASPGARETATYARMLLGEDAFHSA